MSRLSLPYDSPGSQGPGLSTSALVAIVVVAPLENMPMARKTVIVHVNDKMQRGYTYVLTARVGRNFDPEFRPELTPKEMLALGIFCGKYMTDCRQEFPASWFARAKLAVSGRDCSLNCFGVDASQPLSVWRKKGWI